jgi:predicted chitinase
MDAATLSRAMGGALSLARYTTLAGPCTDALRFADCTTVDRAAMFLAQVGTESLGLRYAEEIASGAAYEGRRDLGNTVRGDGVRFKGRSFIQVTGRANYTAMSQWAHGKGHVSAPDYFVAHPAELATERYAFLGAVWYWTVARNMNGYADRADIVGATKAVNGGTNGLADRTARWVRCRGLGAALLSGGVSVSKTLTPTTPTRKKDIMIDNNYVEGSGTLPLILPVGAASGITASAYISTMTKGPRPGMARAWFQTDTAGKSDSGSKLNCTFADGRSTRPYVQVPDGTTMIRVDYSFPDGGSICIEAVGK